VVRTLIAACNICGLLALTGVVFAIPEQIPARTPAIDDEYRQVMDARGRQSETIRLERLLSRFTCKTRGVA
jgi:hypothetical protein